MFAGKVVRKDLLLQVKKGTNVPSFVLEFLLARYCASDDPREIQDGMAAVSGDDPEELRAPRREQPSSNAGAGQGQAHVHRQDPRQVLGEGKATVGADGELQLVAHRDQRDVLQRPERPHLRRRHLGGMHRRPQRRGGRRLRLLHRRASSRFSCPSSTSTRSSQGASGSPRTSGSTWSSARSEWSRHG